MRRLLLPLFSLLFPLCASAEGGLPDRPYIYVEGIGKIQREADTVRLSFTLNSFDQKLNAATKKVQDKANKVFVLLDTEKIAPKDVVSESIQWRAAREHLDVPVGTKGYVAIRDFSVLVRDLNVFPKLVDELLALGVEEFKSIEPGLSNQDELNHQARVKAMADARAQAEKTLGEEKMKIDSVFAVSFVPIPRIRSELLGDSGPNFGVVGGSRGLSDAGVQYRLAPVITTQPVHIIYLISPAP